MSNLARGYFLELEVTDDPITGATQVAGRLYEEEGGPQLLMASFTDTYMGGVPPYASGTAAASAFELGDGVLDATFDNIRAEALFSGLTWDGMGDDNWDCPRCWIGGTPDETTDVMIPANTVTVAADGSARSLTIEGDGRLAVSPGSTLTVLTSLELAAGGLSVQGTLNADTVELDSGIVQLGATGLLQAGDLEVGDDVIYAVEFNEAGNGQITATYDVFLAGTLAVVAADRLETVGQHTRTIVQITGEEGTIFDTFAAEPATGDHIGYGVFHQEVVYTETTVEVDLLQAAPGDTDGNRDIDNADLQSILAANSFNNGTGFDWPQGDFDGDTDVDNADLQLILATGYFGTGPYAAVTPDALDAGLVVVPEPATLALLASGMLGLLVKLWRRRKRG